MLIITFTLQARTVANRIQVGVSLDLVSTLQPRLPDTVDEMSTSTHVSAYFRTKEKNGFILYLGNPKDTMLRRTKSVGYVILVGKLSSHISIRDYIKI